MDKRQYDPAIARWVVQDPVVHHNFSPYSAFDNNPVYWADPSGADASDMMGTDMDGNQRYTVGGQYIPKAERDGRSNTFYMGGGGTTSYGKADFLGKWVKHKVGTEVTYAKDNGDSLLEEIIFKNIYEYEFVQNDGPSTFDLINGAIGSYLTLLDEYAGANSKYVYKYGTKAISAAALTQANAARMLGIAKNAQIVGNTLGIITGGYSLYKAEQKRRTTGEIDVKGYLDGTIGLAGGIAGTIVTFGLVSNPAGWAILATGAAIYGIGSFIYDVNNANE